MKQIITAKLKLIMTPEQKESVRQVTLAYRDALNYTSEIAFDNNKLSQAAKLQKLVYRDIRGDFKLPSQMSCNVPRQVAATYKTQWTKFRQNQQAREQGHTKKRYKGLDKPQKFRSRTCTLNYQRDYSFKPDQKVSIVTLSGRIVVSYTGYNKHLELIKNGSKIGAAKIYYNCSSKTYYLLVSLEIELPEIKPETINKVKGVDVGQRYLAVSAGIDNSSQFFSGQQIRHKANRYYKARKSLQHKGTRSAKRRLITLSSRERRFIADINHQISKEIAQSDSFIGLENLTHIRERIRFLSGKKASKKQRRANRNKAQWSFAELHSFVDYKAVLNNSLAVKVPAHYTSQMCPKCGHVSKENRPNKGLIFDCKCCHYKLHADLVGARNIALRALLIRQDWMSTGILSASPNVSDVEAKAKDLQKFLELRWSLDASSCLSDSGQE
ncbi:RNA-guided endonuclease InsQ/TnpB family protein [Crocosphaera sp.]|uniref:RNA-guided endonuclease InsQ/TnpB family protein n=1 Tax=Crocosphaera sp. TaxID=2729996 RepID=UPI003F20074A